MKKTSLSDGSLGTLGDCGPKSPLISETGRQHWNLGMYIVLFCVVFTALHRIVLTETLKIKKLTQQNL